jgi:phage FluMu gp28-like protein
MDKEDREQTCTLESPVNITDWKERRFDLNVSKKETQVMEDVMDVIQTHVEMGTCTYDDLMCMVKFLLCEIPQTMAYHILAEGIRMFGSQLSEAERTKYGSEAGVTSVTVNAPAGNLTEKEIREAIEIAQEKKNTDRYKGNFSGGEGNA